MRKPKPIIGPNDPRIKSWFSLDRYKRLPATGYYFWAMQVAVRQSSWNLAYHARDEKVDEEVRAMTGLDNAVKMLMTTPLVTWDLLPKYKLDASDFRALIRLIDETESPYPAINAKITIGEVADLVSRARWLAANEPWRCDTEDGAGTYNPEYLPINQFLTADEHVLYMRGRPTNQNLMEQIEYLLYDLPPVPGKTQNPNAVSTSKLMEYRVLECMDLYIWALNQNIDPRDHRQFTLKAIAGLLFGNVGEGWRIRNRTEPLVLELLDHKSRMSRELLALAAQERADATRKKSDAIRRGRRPDPAPNRR